MNNPLQLASIPSDKYSDYRYDVIFKAYKWDPQVEDQNTISKHVVLMNLETAEQLETWAEQMSRETASMEEELIGRISLTEKIKLPAQIHKELHRLSSYDRAQNVRLMRFDFHPVETGWAVSEVNSDVPGGMAEASIMPEIARTYLKNFNKSSPGSSVAKSLLEAFRAKVKEGGRIAFVHATSYSDDRQVMQFLGDFFNEYGFDIILAAPDHLRWNNRKAVSILEGQEGEIDGIVRFFPLEWFASLPKNSNWQGYYDCVTPSCNHPVAILAQSKRLPLIWDELGLEIPTWRRLLPDTREAKSMQLESDWIYKPALGRVGEDISIEGVVSEKEMKLIETAVRKKPKDWVVQRMFKSSPLTADDGEPYHLCVGVFTVDGKAAGFYGRISPYRRIDYRAKDIPILITKEGPDDGCQDADVKYADL
jgi:glutathionylspermidine synthase